MHRRKHARSRNDWAPRLATILFLFVAVLGAACAQANGPTLPAGWTWYRDTHFSFKAPVPPGWRAHAYWGEYFVGDRCVYEVDLIPPVSEASYTEAPPGGTTSELIRIVLPINCPNWNQADNPHLKPQPQSLTISGAPAKLYADTTLAGGYNELAIARFGGQEYEFAGEYDLTATTPASGTHAELAVYMQVLRGFTYTGK